MIRLLSTGVLACALAVCTPGTSTTHPAPLPQRPRPTLVVFLTVDQLHPDYLVRYRSQFTGGLARLLAGGAYFTNGFQDHAITETAPGHASTMSGRFPRSTGIIRNLRGVNDREAPLIGSADLGASPRRFRGTTLIDWLAATDPRTRGLSVSMKDRAAILPIGRSKQQVYWFPTNGIFTTSSWYADTLPAWVRAFNQRRVAQKAAGTSWTPLLPATAYQEPDSVPAESFGRHYTFPHPFPADTANAANLFRTYPMMDELTLEFALEGLQRLGLGRGPSTDILAISLSGTDGVGHRFGPESREIHDQTLRLDRYLGSFLDSLFRLRDSTRILIALTADHGVVPIPELHGKRRVRLEGALAATRAAVAAAGGDTTAVDLESGAFFFQGKGRKEAVAAFTRAAMATPGVARVDRFVDLKNRDLAKDVVARRWVHMFAPDMEPEVVVTLDEGNVYDYGLPATHGSPWDDDAHVPILFYGPAFKPGRYRQFVRVVDMAPTLAEVLGVTPLEPLDGRPLVAAIR